MFLKKSSGSASLYQRLKSAWRSMTPTHFFVGAMTASFAIFLIFYTAVGNGNYVDLFFRRTIDLFMDFFNSVRDASQGEEVYTVRHVIYPPMANLIYLICSRFIPTSYTDSSWYGRYTWSYYSSAILFFFLFTLFFLLVLFFLLYEKKKGSRTLRFWFAIFVVFNVPVLYTVERGNMLLLCLVALLVYGFTYHSENKWYREMGLLALAFAFSLKLYPVVFGWFLLVDKRYKDALRCCIYGILMVILPSFFFGGPAIFLQILRNITSFSSGGTSALTVIANYGHIPMGLITVLAYLWCLVCAVCFAIAPFVHTERRWKCWAIGILTILGVPSLTSLYSWTFFLIPMVALMNQEKHSAKDWFYMVNLTVPFLFTIMRFNSYLTVNSLLVYVFTAILSVTLVTDTLVTFVRMQKAKKLAVI